MVSQAVAADFRNIPPRKIGVNSIHESSVVTHLGRKRAEEMADALLMLDIDLKVSDHHDAAVGTNTLLTTAEFARLHVALHDVHTVLLVEGHTGDLVKTDHVILAYEP